MLPCTLSLETPISLRSGKGHFIAHAMGKETDRFCRLTQDPTANTPERLGSQGRRFPPSPGWEGAPQGSPGPQSRADTGIGPRVSDVSTLPQTPKSIPSHLCQVQRNTPHTAARVTHRDEEKLLNRVHADVSWFGSGLELLMELSVRFWGSHGKTKAAAHEICVWGLASFFFFFF